MSVFAVSFRIADQTVGGRSYEERYSDLVDALTTKAGQFWWAETTSFLLIRTEMSADALCGLCKAKIAQTHDLVFILSTSHLTARLCGKNEDADIHKLLDFVKNC